jgi:hypothetical protein
LLYVLGCDAGIVDLPPSERPELEVPVRIEVTPPRAPLPPELPEPPAIASIEGGWLEGDPLDPCPDGDWPRVQTRGAVFYVKAGEEGDGSIARPFGTISEAVEAAYDHRWATILVGRGTYREVVVVYDRVSIIGACAAETVLDHPSDDFGVIVVGRWARISRMTMRAHAVITPPHFLQAWATLDQVVIESPDEVAGWVVARQTTLSVRRSIVRGIGGFEVHGTLDVDETVFQARQGIWGLGPGAEIRVARSRFEGERAPDPYPPTVGVRGEHRTRFQIGTSLFEGMNAAINSRGCGVELRDVAIRSVSIGVIADVGSELLLERTSISNAEDGPIVSNGSAVSLSDTVIDRSASTAFNLGTHVTAERAAITGARERSLYLSESSTITAVDLTIEDPTPQDDNGVLVTKGSRVSCTRCLMRAGDVTFLDSSFDATDLTLAEGTLFISRSTAELERTTLSSYRGTALVVHDGSAVRASDVRIEEPGLLDADPYDDVGLFASDSVSRFERMEIDGARGIAAILQGETELIDLSIRDVATVGSDENGNGLWIAGGTTLLERAEISRARMVGIVAFGDALVEGSDVRIAGTESGTCTVSSCPYDETDVGGIGFSTIGGARVTLDRFEIERSRLAGAQAVGRATLRLTRGTIAGNEIGIHGDGVSLEDVLFLDNRSNVETGDHVFTPPPVHLPEIAPPPEQ